MRLYQFFPHKEFFVLGMRCGDAVGRLFDLGEAVLFNCHLKYGGYDFEERENRTLYLCNVVNKQLNWIKLILNERYELELRAYVVVDKDDWYNSVLGYIESYVDMALSVYDNC